MVKKQKRYQAAFEFELFMGVILVFFAGLVFGALLPYIQLNFGFIALVGIFACFISFWFCQARKSFQKISREMEK